MKASETQKMLVLTLKNIGMEKDGILGTMLLLHKSEEAMTELGLFIIDNNPSETEIILKAVEIHDRLPKELQTGE